MIEALGGNRAQLQIMHGRFRLFITTALAYTKECRTLLMPQGIIRWLEMKKNCQKALLSVPHKGRRDNGRKHVKYKMEGVQFHPESILTQDGKKMKKEFYRRADMKIRLLAPLLLLPAILRAEETVHYCKIRNGNSHIYRNCNPTYTAEAAFTATRHACGHGSRNSENGRGRGNRHRHFNTGCSAAEKINVDNTDMYR
jgi:hypothetical protein